MTAGYEIYTDIATKLGAPTSPKMLHILEVCFSPEEGQLLLELFFPATSQEVAKRLNADEKKVHVMLESLTDRGMITKGQTQYCFHFSLVAFHHHTIGGVAKEPVPEKIIKAWTDFFFDEWSDIFIEGYIKRIKETGRPTHRVWPSIGALALSPNIKLEQILPEENFKLKLENTDRIIVGHCGCRKNWSRCNHPVETCFAPLAGRVGEFFIDLPSRTSIREISLTEALEVVRRNEEAGLVNTGGGCFCCTCSCEILYSLKRVNRFDLLGKSRYQATLNESKCIGCQDCLEKCPFDAIEMIKVTGSKKMKASIIPEKCMGCGVCIVGCKQRALFYEIVKPPEYIQSPQPSKAPVGIVCHCTEVDR